MVLTNGASFQNRLILIKVLEAFTVKEGLQLFSFSQIDTKHQLYASLSKEPVKFVEQLGDPEKPVSPLKELVSWCLGLWVRSVIDK